jgi:hypothetical protein
MPHPDYSILEMEYDNEHRAAALNHGDHEVPMPPLRARTHSSQLCWDERYKPYIWRAGFLKLVRTFLAGLPPLNPVLLTVAVDR